MKKKMVALLLAVVLCIGCAIGGTVAWLVDKTTAVTNTFTSSDINITLTETKGNNAKMVPGGTIDKDPKVTVVENSEACWLFVKLEKSSNYSTYLGEYVIDNDWWTAVPDAQDVYYVEVSATDAASGKTYPVLEDNQLSVLSSVTKTQMEAIKSSGQPTLTISAYAIQSANLKDADDNAISTASAAWTLAQALANS